MESLHGSTVLRAGRCLLTLAITVCMLLFFPSTPSEVAVVRESFHANVVPLPERRTVDAPPTEHREIIDAPPPPPPPVHQERLPEMARQERRTETPSPPPPPPPPAHRARITEMARQAKTTETPLLPPPPATAVTDPCAGRYIYIYQLPSRFNSDLLRDCRSLSDWMNMCKYVANAGMGPRLTRTGRMLPATGWYDTNQFMLEIIFHSRMRQYQCLTANASRAAAVYVPYYAGLDVGRYLWGFNNSVRDALAEDLVEWLRSSPAWAAHGGQDHFLVGGRIAWDFRREAGEWGNQFLLLPEVRNMTTLIIESSPWHGNVGVPYPTYFHPSSAGEVAAWQRIVRRERRPWLFAFGGGARRNDGNGLVRDRIIDQCARSRRCGLLRCGGSGRRSDCLAPGNVMRLFKSAAFCLQPQGDSYTRRSAFDAMLAGCVPVFFHPGSAYVQYRWHLPGNHSSYSVFVPEDGVRNGTVRVEDVLRRFGAAEVAAMREQVVSMIPKIVYRDPRARAAAQFRDAVDIAVDGVIERVRRIKQGLPPGDEGGDQHQWDGYFD